jgi:hypothetical protein
MEARPEHQATSDQLLAEYQRLPKPPQPTATDLENLPPPPPPRPVSQRFDITGDHLPPPQRKRYSHDEPISSGVHYARDPHRLTAYLVPFPRPEIHKGFLHSADVKDVPERFLIYTPPAPPLKKPVEGEKEGKLHKVQRKWQEEVRAAKKSDAKVTSWKGIRSRVTKGVNVAMDWTTTSGLDFLNRVPDAERKKDKHADDGVEEGDQTKKTVGLEEMVLVYPASVPGTEEEIRTEFVNSMMRTKSKAQRDAVIATGLIPVTAAIDLLATLIWPFGGLLEIDSVWAYSSIRGAKTARSVTKRLHSTEGATLKLTFIPSSRLEVLQKYLSAECTRRDAKTFPSRGVAPTETEVLEAIGWSPSQTGETKNWEDEQWEVEDVKGDLKSTMHKGAREWDKWCVTFNKDPEKALKK